MSIMCIMKNLKGPSGLMTYVRTVTRLYITSKRSLNSTVSSEEVDSIEKLRIESSEQHIYNQLVPWRSGKELAKYLYSNRLYEDGMHIVILQIIPVFLEIYWLT